MDDRQQKIERLQKLQELVNLKNERDRRAKAPSGMESLRRGVGEGLSLGFLDEASAALGAAYDKGQAALGLRGDISFGDAYRTRRDAERARNIEAQKENPKLFTAGEVTGAIGSSIIPGVSALNVGKGAKVGTALAKGAIGGGLVGAGKSNADLIAGEAPKFLTDVASGAAIGGATGAAFNAAGKVLPTLAKKAKESGAKLAFKAAVGNQQKFTDEAIAKGNLIQTGESLLKSGVVEFGDDAAKIAAKVSQAKNQSGKGIGQVLGYIDEVAQKPIVDTNKISTVINDMANDLGKVARNSGVVKYLRKEAENIAKGGNITLKEAQEFKNLFPYQFSATSNLSEKQIATNRINKLFSAAMDDAVESLSKSAGDTLKAAKSEYGAYALAEKAANKLAGRNQKNAYFGLRDAALATGVLGGSIAGGDPQSGSASALAVGLASSILRRRGNSSLAVIMTKLGEKLAKSPQTLGPFAPLLQNAARSGAVPMGAAHLMLMQDPEYVKYVERDAALKKANAKLMDDIEDLKQYQETHFKLPSK